MSYGIFEVFKYCFKDLGIRSQEIFRDLFSNLKERDQGRGMGSCIM